MQPAGIAPAVSTAMTSATSTRQHAPVQAWRLFAAIPLPAAVRAQVAAAQQALSVIDRDVRWVRPEHAHLTLHFLGDTPQTEVADLIVRLSDALADDRALAVRTTGIGAFPNLRRPRVLWLGLSAADDPAALARLNTLASNVHNASGALAAHTERPEAPFVPHITLGRVRPRRQPAAGALAAALAAAELEPVIWQVERVELFRSVLGPAGSTYTGLHTWQLPTPEITDHG